MPVTPAEALIRQRILDAPCGTIPWCEVMCLALYEPGAGYYRQGVRRIGRGGDFFTSVSVGPVFGELLAIYGAQVWSRLGCPDDFAIIEQGANDGSLARDVLEALARDHAALFGTMQYWIVEPDENARTAQADTVGEKYRSILQHATSLEALHEKPTHAVFICNELLDAFPVHRIRFDEKRWMEQRVSIADDETLRFVDAPITDASLIAETEKLGVDFSSGYTTEINLEMLRWLREVTATKFSGTIIILDYGLTADEFFSESRPEGTLRRYHQHRSDDRVLERLGDCDLTTHVNFTSLAQHAQSCGLSVVEFIEQGRFLTKLASGKLKSTEGLLKPEWIRQFQTLTHPNHLGMSFHALILGKDFASGVTPEERAVALRRLGL